MKNMKFKSFKKSKKVTKNHKKTLQHSRKREATNNKAIKTWTSKQSAPPTGRCRQREKPTTRKKPSGHLQGRLLKIAKDQFCDYPEIIDVLSMTEEHLLAPPEPAGGGWWS